MQNRVFVLGTNKQQLMPCHPARARQLLKKGRAAVYRRVPFTIILQDRKEGGLQPIRLKFDPGAETTGVSIVSDFKRGKRCIFAMEITHRGRQIKKGLEKRRGVRRGRRSRLRYRKPRFANRRRKKGWLPPSLQSRVDNIASWLSRFQRWSPITHLSMELVRFDTQAMENPEINGVKYQQGELMGYEIREYLLEKWGRKCAYCKKEGIPLQIEHMTPKSRGGSNRVSNLTLACGPCNQEKGTKTAKEFGFPELEAKGKKPLKSAAIMNATRFAILDVLKATGLPVECGSGGRTKYNRSQQGYAKAHWLDAMCVGESGEDVFVEEIHEVLEVKAMGRGRRQMCNVNDLGFPISKPKGPGRVKGFRSGDLVRAVVPKGKKKGAHKGRVTIRSTGSFNIKTKAGRVEGISWRYCRLIQSVDGYAYTKRMGVSSPTKSKILVGASTPEINTKGS